MSTLVRNPVNLLMIDSNQTQSELLSGALRRHSGIVVTCSSTELSRIQQALADYPIDVILLGGPLDETCYKILHVLHTCYAAKPVILFLSVYDRSIVLGAFRYGVRGLFCSSSMPFSALCRCIDVVHQGQIWINNEQIQYLVDALPANPRLNLVGADGKSLLGPREQEIVSLVVQGLSNRDIAEQLNLSENTVKKTVLHIYDKLGVSNRVELTLYALTPRYEEIGQDTILKGDSERSVRPRVVIHPTVGE